MFAVNADLRVNTVNCVGVMGSGVALAFKERFPEMFTDYQRACREGDLSPGKLHVWRTLLGEWVVNFPTKRDWRVKSRYEDIEAGLKALRLYLENLGPVSVTVPALGCGHGGLDWYRVSPMIQSELAGLQARIYLFEPSDSRASGAAVRLQSLEQEYARVAELGFKVVPDREKRELLALGDPELLSHPWLALLPSQRPSDREMSALDSILTELAHAECYATVALLYLNRTTDSLVRSLADHGMTVVLILPFGALDRPKLVPSLREQVRAIVSIARPAETWSRRLLADSLSFLQRRSGCVLVTGPEAEWTRQKGRFTWPGPLFFVRFDRTVDEVHHPDFGATAISRDSRTGRPNVGAMQEALARMRADH